MATGEYHNFESHCCFCGIVLAAYRTRAHPEEPYPNARWDGGYPGDYVSVDDLAWAFEFRALRDSRNTYNDITPGSDPGDDGGIAPFFTGIGLFGGRASNARSLTAPSTPGSIHSDADFKPGADDTFSIFTSYVSFDNTSGRGFIFHAKCFEIFRTLLPDRFKDTTSGRRAHFVKPEVRDKLWEILSLVRKGLGNGDISGWDDGTSPFRQSINDGTFYSFIDQNSWSSSRTLLDSLKFSKAFCGKGMLPYIAADPLRIPKLQAILNTPPLISAASHQLQHCFSKSNGPKDVFSKLPNEILDIILCQLRSHDVVNLRLAVRSIAESPLTNSFFRSRFKEPHEMHFVYESATARSTEGKIDWKELYVSIKALLIGTAVKEEAEDERFETKNGKKFIQLDRQRHLRRFYKNRICPRLPPAPGLANRLRIHVILKPLIDRITLLIDTQLRGEPYTGVVSFLNDELSKCPSSHPQLDDFSPLIVDKTSLPVGKHGLYYYLGDQGGFFIPFGQTTINPLTVHQVKLIPLRGRARIRIRKTISAGPNVKRSSRDLEERPPDQRQLIHSSLSCVETCARKCTWDPNAVVTSLGFSFVGKADDKSDEVGPDLRKHICGLRFWGRLPPFSNDTDAPELPLVLLGEVGYVMRDEIVVKLPEGLTWVGFMVGVTETGIVRLKPLTNPPWREASWVGSSTSMTESKLGWSVWREQESEDQPSALAKRRAEGFKVIGPVHDYYCDFSYPAAEGRITVSPDKWSISGIAVGLGTLRLTSIALIEYRSEETITKRDKGKGKSKRTLQVGTNTVFIDGEETACEPLPLGKDENLLSDDEHLDGVPDLVDRYCWRPHFPVPHYKESNNNNVTISPQNLTFAFRKTYIQDAILAAGLPIPPETHLYWNGPNFGPPPNTPPLRIPRNRDELNVMEYFDFGGPSGAYLRRLLSIKAFYASHTNGAARGVSGFEFTYEMDEEDVTECKLREESVRPQERYVEVRRGGVDLHYLSCAATIDGKGGERIVRVGTKHLCLSERSYLGVMFITNFGRKLEFPACLPPTNRRRSRRRLRRAPRVYPLNGNPPPPPPPGGGGDDRGGPAPKPFWFPASPGLPPPPSLSHLLGSGGSGSATVTNHSGIPLPPPLPSLGPPLTWTVPPMPMGSLSNVTQIASSIVNGGSRAASRRERTKLSRSTTATTNTLSAITAGFDDAKSKDTIRQEESNAEVEDQGDNSKAGEGSEKATSKSEEEASDDQGETSAGPFGTSSFTNSRMPLIASPDPWDDPYNLGLPSNTSTGKSDDAKVDSEYMYETSTTYDYFDIKPNSLITGFFGCTDGKPYLGEGLKNRRRRAFGIVTQTPSESEREVLKRRDTTKLGPPDELEPGTPDACFSQLERAKYWKRSGDEDVIKDFISKATFNERIARVRIYCRPSYHLFSGYSRHAANGVGLVFEYQDDDLVDDGCGGLRPRAARVLGELREENAAGCFELEKGESIDAIWIWCADRARVIKSYLNDLGFRGADVIAALRFRTNRGRCSRIYGGDRTGTCHFFESYGNKKLVGLRMTYDYMSDWLSPIWREEDQPIVLEKADIRIRHIPFGWSILNKPMSNMQVFADTADNNDFGPNQIQKIRGYFDYQFQGVTFTYKSGETRSFGKCIGASAEFILEDGERIYALRYRPGTNFALHFSLVRVDPETGTVQLRSTPLFGIEVAGFGLPPLNEHVRDLRTWRQVFDDEVKPFDRDYNYSTDESSDYNAYPSSTRHPLEDAYDARHNEMRVKTANSMEANVVQGYLRWDEYGFVDIRPPMGYDFAGLWLQEIDLDFKLGMMITAALNPKDPISKLDYSTLGIPSPASALLPILDSQTDVDDASTHVKTYKGRPFVPPLPWLGTYPTEKLPGDAVLSRKIGAQVGVVRLWTCFNKTHVRDICVYYSFPTRLVHIHGIDFVQHAKYNKQTGYYAHDPEVTRLGTTGFMTTLNRTTRFTTKLREKKMVGLKVGMVPDIYQRLPAPAPGTQQKDVKLADWPIKSRRNKGGEPQIVTIEIIFEDGNTMLLTPEARESTHRNKSPPNLIFDTVMCPEGHEIVGLHGNFGIYCHSLGIISAPFKAPEKRSPQSGNPVTIHTETTMPLPLLQAAIAGDAVVI